MISREDVVKLGYKMKEKEKLSNLDYHLEVYHSYYNLHIN